MSSYSLPDIVEGVNHAKEIIKPWNYDSAGILIQDKIKKEARLNNIIAVANCTAGLLLLVVFIVPFDDEDFFFPIVVFEKFFPQWKYLFNWVFRVFLPCTSLLIQAPFYVTIYSILRVKFQIYTLTGFVKNLNCGYRNKEICELIKDSKYQEEIFKRLKFCIERQKHIYRYVGLYSVF